MITISNCPITGLERKIVSKNTLFFETTKQLVLDCTISHFKGGVVIENQRIKTYGVQLVADNSSYVNKNTGEFITDEFNELTGETIKASEKPDAIGQFDFFASLQFVPVIQNDLVELHISRADELGRFNP
jgi:hypothetical protein